jgi:predicted NBD/HSP70 family sugar kinase
MIRYGVDIGGTKVAAAAIDDAGRRLDETRTPIPREDYEGTVEAVRSVVRELASRIGAPLERLGVCAPGIVEAAAGRISLGNTDWLRGRPFRDDVAAAVGAPVRLANDADCFALSEAADGAGQGAASVFGVILGTGVGGGFVVGGRLVSGPRGIAGEIGHVPLPRGSAEELAAGPCSCGRRGCVEALLSGPSLTRDFRAVSGREAADARAVAALAEAGDADACAAFARYEDRLARALAMLVNLVEPEAIVLGGGVSNVGRLYENVPALMVPHVFGGVCATRLARAQHGDSSGVRGAARLWDH